MADPDDVADLYDRTRGGERRGDAYAAAIWARLPAGRGPVLEVGVGTGVVALGLARRGWAVLGVDVSGPMLRRARERLGTVVAQSDGTKMAIASGSVAHAVSVWLVHAVKRPALLFREVARVLGPQGTYVVCTTQRPAQDDHVGQAVKAMGEEIDRRRGAARPMGVTTEQVLTWAAGAGFHGTIGTVDFQWKARPSDELLAIETRSWPAMRDLDESTLAGITEPAVHLLRSLPDAPALRRAIADVLVLRPR